MSLIKTSIYTSISQALTIISGLISIKVVSYKLGPKGMAMVGQYLNTTTLLTLFASGAIGVGVVKYISQYYDDKPSQFRVIRTAFWITIGCSVVVALIAILGSVAFSRTAFKTDDYYLVYILWGSFLFFTSFSALAANILNGLKLIPWLTIVNITGTITGLLVTIVLVYQFGVFGALIAANFTSLILFILHLYFINKYKWFSLRSLFAKFDTDIVKLLMAFVLMALVSGIMAPSIQLLVRDRIINRFSFQEAGYWQAVTRVSDYYLGFITTVIAVYYLPRLSEIKTNTEIKTEIWKTYKMLLPVVAGMSFLIWLCRYIIIRLVLTPEFLPSAELYGFQFFGDFFKIAGWLLAYVLIARAMKFWYIFSEIVFSLTYVFLCYVLIERFGIIGAVYGFLINYILYWIFMFFLIKAKLK